MADNDQNADRDMVLRETSCDTIVMASRVLIFLFRRMFTQGIIVRYDENGLGNILW